MNNTKAKMNSSKISVAKKTENGSVVKKMKAVEKMKNQKEKERSGNSDRSLSLCLLLTLLFTGGQRNFQSLTKLLGSHIITDQTRRPLEISCMHLRHIFLCQNSERFNHLAIFPVANDSTNRKGDFFSITDK